MKGTYLLLSLSLSLLLTLLTSACIEELDQVLIRETLKEMASLESGEIYKDEGILLGFEVEPERGLHVSYKKGSIEDVEIEETLHKRDQLIIRVSIGEEESRWSSALSIGSIKPLLSLTLSLWENSLIPLQIHTGLDPIEEIFRVWLLHVRPFKSTYLYWFFRETLYTEEFPSKWVEIKHLSREEFGERLMEYPFLMDPGLGVLDFSPKEEDFFFLERRWGRDCDNWSRMWFWWAVYHGYPVWEIAIMDGFDITTAHMITVFKDGSGYTLCNYTIVDTYSSLEEAVLAFQRKELTRYGLYRDVRWVIYQESIPST